MNKKYVLYLMILALLGLVAPIYWNSLYNDFVNMDDLDLIVRNTYIKSLTWQNIKAICTPGVVGAYQPVRTLSYAVDYHFWKLNPVGYHLTNIFCHAVSTILVLLIVQRLSNAILLASFTALFFAIHPVHVEAVTWMSGRRDVLSGALVLLAFYTYLRFAGKRALGWYALSVLSFAVGLLTKPSAIVLPLLLLLHDVTFPSKPVPPLIKQLRKNVLAYLPYGLICTGFGAIFMSLSKASGVAKASYHGGNAYITALTMLRVFAEYLWMLLVPNRLSLTYGIRTAGSFFEPSVLAAIAVLGIIGVLTIMAWKRSKIVFFGICWFFIGLLPVSNIIPIGVIKADRYLYLPSVGFFLALAWLIERGWKVLTHAKIPKIIKIFAALGYLGIIAVVAFSYATLTMQRNQDWKNSETLWTVTLETTPNSSIALNNLGLIYADRGLYDKAIALYEQLLAYHPDQEHIERVYVNLANAYLGKQMIDEALDAYEHALEAQPDYVDAYIGLGQISSELEQYDKAAAIYQAALELHPQSAGLYNQLGNLSYIQSKYDEAIQHYQQAITLNPEYIAAYNGLGLSYAAKGATAQALAAYQRALRIAPDSAFILNSLGMLYMEQGDVQNAIEQFQKGLKYEPDNPEVRNNLGLLLLRTRRYEDALLELMTAVKLQPDSPKLVSNLGIAYAAVGLYPQAIQMFREAIRLDPALLRTYVLLGDVCFATQDLACAIEAYQQALTLQPGQQEVQERLRSAQEQQAQKSN